MKKIYPFAVVILLCFSVRNSFAEVSAVKQQLEKLNKYWITSDCESPVLCERKNLPTDVELIQMHLTLVEQHLRNKKTNLTAERMNNRLRMLDTLHVYMQRGIFPKNLCHQERTPYFIDNFGTACAVGQLIISSGYESFAKRISKENNYAYIENMHYPELLAWTDKFGFEVEELRWIQPTYCYSHCESNTFKNVSCFGKSDGCIAQPAPTIPNPPYTYKFYFSQNEQWYNFDSIISMSFAGCDLKAGKYKWVITNSLNNTEDFVYNITQPDSITTSISVTDDNGLCTGGVSLDISGGTSPYTFFLIYNEDTLTDISHLCSGMYEVVIKDNSNSNSSSLMYSHGCYKKYTVNVDVSSGINKNQLSKLSISPNPSSGKFTLTSDIPQSGVIEVYSITGARVETRNCVSLQQITVDISQQPKGVYLVKVYNAESVWAQRVIVE